MATGAAQQTKFLLDESQLPRRWYNIRADMPTAPQPVLHPGSRSARTISRRSSRWRSSSRR
jgi:tryptophan synthase beta chain